MSEYQTSQRDQIIARQNQADTEFREHLIAKWWAGTAWANMNYEPKPWPVTSLEEVSDFRAKKAQEYPEDTRNQKASDFCAALAKAILELGPDNPVMQAYLDMIHIARDDHIESFCGHLDYSREGFWDGSPLPEVTPEYAEVFVLHEVELLFDLIDYDGGALAERANNRFTALLVELQEDAE